MKQSLLAILEQLPDCKPSNKIRCTIDLTGRQVIALRNLIKEAA